MAGSPRGGAADPGKKLTPVMRQYDDAKRAYPGAILFFRLGDFYEMFHDDAVVASRALEIALTSRNKGSPDEIPMAGVPAHSAHSYVARLIAQGFQVAICEQMADPSKVKGIVPRQVVRVITPGLVTDADHLDARANNFLAAIDARPPGPAVGLALLDLSTAELAVATLESAAHAMAELGRADPREVLLDPKAPDLRAAVAIAAPRAVLRDDGDLADAEVAPAIDGAVDAPLAADAQAAHEPLAVRACARALRYAKSCTPTASVPVRRVARLEAGDVLRIDETAQTHLELVRAADGGRRGSLLDTIDATITPGGARMLRRRLLAPLLDVATIRRRLDEVETFVTHTRARRELREALDGVGDLERLAVRAQLGQATPRDLGAMRDGLVRVPQALAAIAAIPDPAAHEALDAGVDACADLVERLGAALVERPPPTARDGGVIADGFDPDLDELRAIQRGGTEHIVALESRLREETGAPSLRVKYTRVFGWYIEMTRAQMSKAPAEWRRKQTVAQGERYTNDELDGLADRIEHAEERAIEREGEIFAGLVAEAARASDRVRALALVVARWDVAAALAETAHRHDYVRPDVDAGDRIEIRDGRHPVVERLAAAGRFVPNDAVLDLEAERMWLVTGPNMAGKSTFMRQVALCVILAQAGSYVPAKRARVGLVDRVLSRVGASDNLARGESTFMVEMRETASILRDATRRSLVILDEIGRGTSTYDGLAIAWAVAEHLYETVGCRTLFATHYHELTELAKLGPGIANWSVSAREHGDDVVFLHRLVAGPASRSYGVAVARLAGLPEPVLARARAMLATLESGSAMPTGGRASLRPRGSAAQLDLFAPQIAEAKAAMPVVETLKAVDIDRLTPLEALQLLAKLKNLLP